MYMRWVIINLAKKLYHLVRGKDRIFYSLASIAVILSIILILLISYSYSNAFALQGSAIQSTSMRPVLAWNKSYDSKGQDAAYVVIQVNDGYIVAGDQGNDAGLMKTDLNGNKIWRESHGAEGTETARAIMATNDGYVVAGSSSSYEGFGVNGVYLLKTDLFGREIWHKTFSYKRNGILTNAIGKSAIAVNDGYVIVGEANADVNGGPDIYLIKTDLNGEMDWKKTIGGDADEHGNAIIAARDGFIIAGDTCSYGNKDGSSDVYLVKTDFEGNIVWEKTFGGTREDIANSLVAVDDGYVIVGSTKSYGDPSKYDIYLVKTDLNGNLIWEKHFGQTDDDQGKSIVSVDDGYVIAGYTSSFGNFYKDVYLFKTDLNGEQVWNRTYGGADMDEGNCIIKSGDGFVIAGYTCSYGIYTSDFCLIKIDPDVQATAKATATAAPTQETVAPPTAQAGPLSMLDTGVLVGLTLVIVVVAMGAVVALYLLPKK